MFKKIICTFLINLLCGFIPLTALASSTSDLPPLTVTMTEGQRDFLRSLGVSENEIITMTRDKLSEILSNPNISPSSPSLRVSSSLSSEGRIARDHVIRLGYTHYHFEYLIDQGFTFEEILTLNKERFMDIFKFMVINPVTLLSLPTWMHGPYTVGTGGVGGTNEYFHTNVPVLYTNTSNGQPLNGWLSNTKAFAKATLGALDSNVRYEYYLWGETSYPSMSTKDPNKYDLHEGVDMRDTSRTNAPVKYIGNSAKVVSVATSTLRLLDIDTGKTIEFQHLGSMPSFNVGNIIGKNTTLGYTSTVGGGGSTAHVHIQMCDHSTSGCTTDHPNLADHVLSSCSPYGTFGYLAAGL